MFFGVKCRYNDLDKAGDLAEGLELFQDEKSIGDEIESQIEKINSGKKWKEIVLHIPLSLFMKFEEIEPVMEKMFYLVGDILQPMNWLASSKSNAYSDLHIVPASTTRAFLKEGLTVSPQAFSSEEEISARPAVSILMDAV